MRRPPNQPHPGEAYALTYGTAAIECRPQLGEREEQLRPNWRHQYSLVLSCELRRPSHPGLLMMHLRVLVNLHQTPIVLVS